MEENRTVEFKARKADTFLKTGSAYANYGGARAKTGCSLKR